MKRLWIAIMLVLLVTAAESPAVGQSYNYSNDYNSDVLFGIKSKDTTAVQSANNLPYEGSKSLQTISSVVDIVVDGNSTDWPEDCLLGTNSTDGRYKLYANINNGKLYLMAKGIGFQATIYNRFYIDSDNLLETGYKKWSDGGSDFMIDYRGRIYRYRYVGNPDEPYIFEYIKQLTEYQTNNAGTITEAAIDLYDLGYSGNGNIRVGHFYDPDGINYLKTPAKMGEISPYVCFTAIPNAIGLGIDDAGWLTMHYDQTRNYTLNDYQSLVNVGRRSGSRLMTAWILGELDKTGVTMKSAYNPPFNLSWIASTGYWIKPNLTEANALMDFVKNNPEYMEFGLHGVTHGHYALPSESSHAEWGDKSLEKGKSMPWDWLDMNNHADAVLEIIREYFDAETCSYPKSFVAPSHGYYYGDGTSNKTTGALLSARGVKYANGDVQACTSFVNGGIDNGLLYIRRGFGAEFNAEGKIPWDGTTFKTGEYPGDGYGWTEAHFPNLWNAEDAWVSYLRGINNNAFRYLPANTAQCSSQWLYKNYATLTSTGTYTATLNTNAIPDAAYSKNLLGTLVLKTKLGGKHISSATIDNGAQISGYYEDEFGYGYLIISNKNNTMGRLNKGVYNIECTIGNTFMTNYVDVTGATYNLYSYDYDATKAEVKLEMYGTQDVRVKLPFTPHEVVSTNPKLKINSWSYTAPILTVNVTGKNIQGEEGSIYITPNISTVGASGSFSINNASAVAQVAVTAYLNNVLGIPLNTYIVVNLYDKDTSRLIGSKALSQRIYTEGYAVNEKFILSEFSKNIYAKIYIYDSLSGSNILSDVKAAIIAY